MTRKDAILYMILKREELKNSVSDLSEGIKALDLAIKALKQEPCEDCISRQAVLKTISKLNAISFYEAQEDSKECYYEIRQAIENEPPVTSQRWIPVSERLPEHSGNYLVTIADSNYENGQVFKISWFYPSDHRWSFKNANVLAWMPLPEPYKAESEEY